MSANPIPAQPVSTEVLLEKYAKGGERTAADVQRRVARALASVEQDPDHWAARFFQAQQQGFLPAGRIASAAGTELGATLINCFVQPVGDSVVQAVEGRPGIYTALAQAAETMRRGGGVGYDFSAIRPRGARVRGTASRASGPVSYMRVFDRSCETVESAGARRGAQMGILRCDHPDVLEFVHAKDRSGELCNFNLSVAVSDALMQAVREDARFELVHRAEPSPEAQAAGVHRRPDGLWVYRQLPARTLWADIMRSTYDHAEPGVVFIDRINRENNLWYAETIEATNPCSEQPLPAYGCCCLGSIDLTRFIDAPFGPEARFDAQRFGAVVETAVRMLDNVLECTVWPLPEQRSEAMAKRRVGLGFTGLGDALVMLGLRYDSAPARERAAAWTRMMTERAYAASVALAREKGAFPLFDAERYLASPFIGRLPAALREDIARHGVRNAHLISIAPTGTISLAFADNVSNGIEPAFAWRYQRKKRLADGGHRDYTVEDHAYRLHTAAGGDPDALPACWVTALEIAADDHVAMLAAVQPWVDASISKTVNVPVDYPFADFESLYMHAWEQGLKGLSTFRPNPVTGAVLSTGNQPQDLDQSDPDRRVRLDKLPQPALASLRWAKRPWLPAGNPGWTYMVDHPLGRFAVFIGHIEHEPGQPFEVWVNGAEQPRGLGALAKSLSMDMRSQDRAWLRLKLERLVRLWGDDAFDLPLPPSGAPRRMPSLVAGFAWLLRHRCECLGAFSQPGPTPVVDALMSLKAPRSGADGTMSWTVDIHNPATGEDFVMGLRELLLPDGQRRPYALWLAGEYPRVLDGLAKSLSFDMRVIDPAWVGAKLRQLMDYPEPLGEFLAAVPGGGRRNYPSTVAFMTRLVIHRYAMLGLLDEQGEPVEHMGLVQFDDGGADRPGGATAHSPALRSGRRCAECGCAAVVKREGCDFCTACGALSACG